MKSTIDSVLHFSKYKIILYCIDFPINVFTPNERLIVRYLNNIFITINHTSLKML